MVSAAGEDTARVHLLDINGGPSGGHVFELPRDEILPLLRH
jgi:hypothetical protein